MASTKSGEQDFRQLGWLLAWAVVFCDIGTSVYYVPGILYGEVGNLAPAFVALTTIGFILLAAKYVEVSWRYPDGGGVSRRCAMLPRVAHQGAPAGPLCLCPA